MEVYSTNATRQKLGQAIADYRQRGWNVIPLRQGTKKPHFDEGELKPYLYQRPDSDTVREWYKEGRFEGVAVVTGPTSRIVVLDVDGEAGKAILKEHGHPPTPTVSTSKGLHLYFKHPGGAIQTCIGLEPKLDLKAAGGYVAAPPTAGRKWVIAPEECELAELPEWVMERVRLRGAKAKFEWGEDIPNGERNKRLTSLAGKLRYAGLDAQTILSTLAVENQRLCKPPLEDNEVRKIAESIARYERGNIAEFVSSEYKRDNSDETNSVSKPLPIMTGREISEATPVKTAWVAYPWFAKGTITEVSGSIKRAGKTTFMAHVCRKIVDGAPFMGNATEKTGVIYLTEQSPSSFRRVIRDAKLERDDVHVLYWHECRCYEWPELIAAVIEAAKERGAGFIVIDVLSRWCNAAGVDENSPEYANRAMPPLKDAVAQGLTVAYVRHDRKGGGEVGESGRGSSQIGGDADQLLQLSRPTGGNARPTVRVLSAVGRFGDDTPEQLTIELKDGEYRSLGDSGAFARNQAMQTVVDVLPAKLGSAIPSDEVVNRAVERGCTRTHVYDALKTLTDAGTVKRVGKGKKGDPHRYYKPPPGEEEFVSSETLLSNSDETNSQPNPDAGGELWEGAVG